ncbi:MAG: LamG domain-containing protein, partial [Bacteroidota bacterium]|nr:LamG domain-containing protein [Bacteroidota bacterium]MDX5430089.1 LamG domain-containing protein [Bacteroidota bacterium]MDX5468853.1 LamG domain-containing protein [Bacteroidota bacterium]
MSFLKINLRYSLSFLLVWCSLASLQAKVDHLDSIKLYIPFYGNLNDWSGWNNNGVADTLHFTSDRNNAPEKAFSLNANNPNIRSRATFLNTNTYSLMFWFRFPELPTDTLNWMYLGDPSCYQHLKVISSGSDSLHVFFEYREQDSVKGFDFEFPYQAGRWDHFTWMKSEDSVYAFVNAFFRFESPLAFQVCGNADSLFIGAHQGTSLPNMDIDELRWFSENIEPSLMFSLVLSERTSLQTPESGELRVLPNPSRQNFTIHFPEPAAMIEFFNFQGQLLSNKKSPGLSHTIYTVAFP